jgi:GT2 family glycosyltransferase
VSDDGHDPATEAVCRAAPVPVDYVLGPQRGLGANRNRAIEAATGDAVLFLDDDCLLAEDFLTVAVARLAEAEATHGSGRVIVSGREHKHGELVTAHDQSFLGFQSRSYQPTDRRHSIVINATLFPAAVFAAQRFDPQLVYGYEEVDFASRAAAAGYEIVHCPDAVNDHRPSPSSRDDYDRHDEASRLHVTLRRYALTERAPARAAAFALVAPVHMLAANVKRLGLAGVPRTAVTVSLAVTMLWRAR